MRIVAIIALGLAVAPAPFAFADWTDQLGKSKSAVPLPVEKPALEVKEPVTEPTKAVKPVETPSTASRLKACPALVSGAIEGKYLPPVRTQTLCGDEAPLLVTHVRGVALKPSAQMNCAMTVATVDWVTRAKELAQKTLGSDLTIIQTASSYVCRRRNNRPDGKFSEHATMNALDVSGFTLKSGKSFTLLQGWQALDVDDAQKTPEGRFLREVHSAACKVFTTTLGPEANAAHENHFHFDMGCHGKRCTYRLCE